MSSNNENNNGGKAAGGAGIFGALFIWLGNLVHAVQANVNDFINGLFGTNIDIGEGWALLIVIAMFLVILYVIVNILISIYIYTRKAVRDANFGIDE